MKRVLHVDDDEAYRILVTEYLRIHFQIEVESASSGHEARRKIEELSQQSAGYDLIISDLVMPDGDGNELFQYVNAYSKQSHFIFLTNSPHQVRICDPTIFYCILEKTELRSLREKVELAICD
jgi:DNA-binding response OmpR family regulator